MLDAETLGQHDTWNRAHKHLRQTEYKASNGKRHVLGDNGLFVWVVVECEIKNCLDDNLVFIVVQAGPFSSALQVSSPTMQSSGINMVRSHFLMY